MPETTVVIELESSGGAVTSAPGVLQRFAPVQRAVRTGTVLLIGLVAAATLIPIPIIHLIGIPLVLVAALITATRQAMSRARLRPTTLACPNCGAANRVGGGLGLRSDTDPVELSCDSCRRSLTLHLREGSPPIDPATFPR